MAFKTFATYQGKFCHAVQYRRSDGLRPEPGSVELNLADIGEIKVVFRSVPWGSKDEPESPGQLSIDAWKKIVQPSIQEKPKEQPEAPAKGLHHHGSLVMWSLDGAGQQLSDRMVYNWVFVDSTGIEDSGPQIAAIKAHDRGLVRVPLTDIRRYYRDHGLFVGSLNVKDDRGIWDPASLDASAGDGTLRPHPWEVVVRYLFALLPGSPRVLFDRELSKNEKLLKSEPGNLIGRGDPALDLLERLLEESGVVPKFQPNGHYILSTRGSKIVPDAKVPVELGRYIAYDHEHYETKTSYCTDRPPLVCVIGQRRVRRITIPYAPVLQDEDGLIYRLQDVEKVLGYKLEDLNHQVFSVSPTQYADCPPRGDEASGQPGVREWRIGMLKRMAYKAYAPASLFAGPFAVAKSLGGVLCVSPGMMARQPFAPLVDAAWYQREIQNLGLALPVGSAEGDEGPYAILPPVVRAKRVGDIHFNDLKEMDAYFEQMIAPRFPALKALQEAAEYVKELAEHLEHKFILELQEKAPIDRRAEGPFTSIDKLLTGLNVVLRNRARADIEKNPAFDFQIAAEKFRLAITKETLVEFENSKNWFSIEVKPRLQEAATMLGEQIGKEIELIKDWEAKAGAHRNAFRAMNGIPVNANVPWGMVSGADSWIDRRTGLLIAPEPLAHASKPFWTQSSGIVAGTDGAVVVTAGYEVCESATGGLTMVLFAAGGTDDEPKPVYCGMNRPSALKGRAVRLPKMRLYENDLGSPMNAGEVVQDAHDRCVGILSMPLSATGFTYQLPGLVKAILEGGVNSIQHVFDADHPGQTLTWVAVNSPGFRGPLGPVLPPKTVNRAEIREYLEGGASDQGRNIG